MSRHRKGLVPISASCSSVFDAVRSGRSRSIIRDGAIIVDACDETARRKSSVLVAIQCADREVCRTLLQMTRADIPVWQPLAVACAPHTLV